MNRKMTLIKKKKKIDAVKWLLEQCLMETSVLGSAQTHFSFPYPLLEFVWLGLSCLFDNELRSGQCILHEEPM